MYIRWKIHTKRIGTTFLQISEWSITNGLEFISLTLQYLFVDVKPYPVSNLELMINPMLVMSRFILFLNFFQLLCDCLVHLLDPLDAIVGSILYSLFIFISISLIHEVQSNFR
jgi:hypothetical protein